MLLIAFITTFLFLTQFVKSTCSPSRTTDDLIPTNPGIGSAGSDLPALSQDITFSNDWQWYFDSSPAYPLSTTSNSFTMSYSGESGVKNEEAWRGMYFPTNASTQNLFALQSTHVGTPIQYKISLKFDQAATNRDENGDLPTAKIEAFIFSRSKLAEFNAAIPDEFAEDRLATHPGVHWMDPTEFPGCAHTESDPCVSPVLRIALHPNSIAAGNIGVMDHEENVVGIGFTHTSATTPTKLSSFFNITGNNDSPCTDCMIAFRLEATAQPEWEFGSTWTIRDVKLERLATVSSPTLQDGSSEVVDVLKMESLSSVESDEGPRVNCPHLQSGLKNWEDASTWDAAGGVPVSGSSGDITIPSNTKVLIRSCSLSSSWTSPYEKIIVPSGSELIFDDANIDIYVKEIFVSPGGKLSVGSSTCRLYSKIQFFFVGSRLVSSIDHGDMSKPSKGIISEGELNIFGKRYHPTWTRLALAAKKDDEILYLQDAVNWEVGQEIVVVTSEWNDSPANQQNERVKIVGIDPTRKVIKIDRKLLHPHYCGIEYQAEVILLSRRIRMEGSDSNDKYGGHTEIRGQSIGRFGGIEAVHMGQQNVMARYPFHWHVNGISDTSMISDCSIHDSFWRAVTIHGTNNMTISRNVAFNISGHCYYLEDGVEEDNLFEYNAAVHVNPIAHVASGPQTGEYICSGCPNSWIDGEHHFNYSKDELAVPADVAASGYYIPNAYNRFIGNVASGGWSGFAFINMRKPMGVFKGVDKGYMNPIYRPTLEFAGNTAHSSGFSWGRTGACIYAGGELMYDDTETFMVYHTGRPYLDSHPTAISATQEARMYYENTKVYLCALGIQHWGDRSGFYGLEAHDTMRGTFVIGSSFIDHALYNGRSGNVAGTSGIYDREGFVFYDTFVRQFLNDATFRNFDDDEPIMKLLTFSMRFLPQAVAAVNDIRFENCPNYLQYRLYLGWCGPLCAVRDQSNDNWETQASRIMATYDQDGSTSLTNNPTLIGSTRLWWNYRDDCVYDENILMWKCPYDGNNELTFLDLDVIGVTEGFRDEDSGNDKLDREYPNSVGYVSMFGPLNYSVPFGSFPGVAGPTGVGWYLRPKGGAPKTVVIGRAGMQMIRDTFVVLAIKYPSSSSFSVKIELNGLTNYSVPSKPKNEVLQTTETLNDPYSLSCPSGNGFCSNTGGIGPSYHFDGTFLYVRIVNPVYYVTKTHLKSFVMEYKGMKLGETVRENVYFIESTCNGCASVTSLSNALWDVMDELPPSFPGQVLKAPGTNYNGPPAIVIPPPSSGAMTMESGNINGTSNSNSNGSGLKSSTRRIPNGGLNMMMVLVFGGILGAILIFGCMCICICLRVRKRRMMKKEDTKYDVVQSVSIV